MCTRPDRDVPALKCGYPLPCPHHTIVIDASQEGVIVRIPRAAKYPSSRTRAELISIGRAVKK